MSKLVVLALLLVAATARAEDVERLDVAQAFRNCSLVQKTDPKTLTDHGKTIAVDCLRLAIAYQDGKTFDTAGPRIEVNAPLALEYYFVGCKYGMAEGCLDAAEMLEKGQVVPPKGKDPVATAILFYTAGCNTPIDENRLGSGAKTVALACSGGGVLVISTAMKKKHPGGAQLKNGVKMIERACQLGDDGSCRALAKFEQSISEIGK